MQLHALDGKIPTFFRQVTKNVHLSASSISLWNQWLHRSGKIMLASSRNDEAPM